MYYNSKNQLKTSSRFCLNGFKTFRNTASNRVASRRFYRGHLGAKVNAKMNLDLRTCAFYFGAAFLFLCLIEAVRLASPLLHDFAKEYNEAYIDEDDDFDSDEEQERILKQKVKKK